MRRIRTYHEVNHATGSELLEQVQAQRARLAGGLAGVDTILAVASGKGGVGKSAVTANLAAALAARGHRVGAVDADLNGPSLGRMLGVEDRTLVDGKGGVLPPEGAAGVRIISMEFLQDAEDAPLRWREPSGDGYLWQSSVETTALREFLGDVKWGTLDFLLVDVPPGTDKIRRLLDLLPDLPMTLLVTTPAESSRFVVARSVRLVREAGVEGVGLVANMTAYACPGCGHRSPLFAGDGHRRLAEATGLPLWGEIPFDPALGEATDSGRPLVLDHPESPGGAAVEALAVRVENERVGS